MSRVQTDDAGAPRGPPAAPAALAAPADPTA